MRVYGLDFTSAPTPKGSRAARRKRLMLASCTLDGATLRVDEVRPLNGAGRSDFGGFEAWLRTEGPWVAGLDFPFGQPAALVRALGWPDTWPGYVAHAASLGKAGFERALIDYKAGQAAGRKELRRPVDAAARSVSPMKLAGVPIGKMFFQGAPRLLASPASIIPLRPLPGEGRVVVEAYPALVARTWIGRRSYKHDDPKRAGEAMRSARVDLIRAIRDEGRVAGSPSIRDLYGFALAMPPGIADESASDATGDLLDSILAAVQAAWAHRMRGEGYGIPAGVDPLEGWIADPGLSGGVPAVPGVG